MKFESISGSARSNRRRTKSPVPQAAETFEQRMLLTILSPTGTIGNSTPTITWQAVNNAVSYDLYVSNAENQTLLFLREDIAATSFTPSTSLTQGRIRVWVRANLADNTTTAWSPSHDFIISTDPRITGPGSAAQTAAQRRVDDTTPTITWTGAAGTSSFELYLSNRTTLESQVITVSGQTQQSTIRVQQSPGAGTFRLNLTALEGTGTTPVSRLTTSVPYDASAEELQSALRQVSGYESARVSEHLDGNVRVYSVRFYGSANPVTVAVEKSVSTGNFVVNNSGVIDTRLYEIPDSAELSMGRYQLFIRGTDASGRRTPWSQAWGFDVAPSVQILSPRQDEGATEPILTFDNSPLLRWAAIPDATHYDIWVSTVGREAASQAWYRQTLGAVTSFQIPRELPAGDYVFWVRARMVTTEPVNSVLFGLWSQRTEFSTAAKSVVPQSTQVVVGNNPTTGTYRLRLTQVVTGAQTQTTVSVPFNATGAQLQAAIRQLSGYSSVLVTSENDGPNLPETRNNIRHTIRFAGVRGAVVVSVLNSTNTGTFSVVNQSPATTILLARPRVTGPLGEDSAEPGVTVVHSPRPTISWQRIDQAARYEIWIDTSASTTPYLQTTSPLNSYTLESNITAGRYVVWIRAVSVEGAFSQWSQPFSFTASGGTTQIVSPLNGATAASPRPEISWTGVPLATSYEIWIDAVGVNFQYIRDTGITGTSYTPTFDLPIGNYRVWVRAIDSDGTPLGWSSAVHFDVVDAQTTEDAAAVLLTVLPTVIHSEQDTHASQRDMPRQQAVVASEKSATPPASDLDGDELTDVVSAVPPQDLLPSEAQIALVNHAALAVAPMISPPGFNTVTAEQLKQLATDCETSEWWTVQG